eukprot:jgi/Chrzof1/12616/Cz07g01090.t1
MTQVSNIGSYFPLVGFDPTVRDVFHALALLLDDFDAMHENYRRCLQLLRFVGAPGLGKSTALVAVWLKLYEMVTNEVRGPHVVF